MKMASQWCHAKEVKVSSLTMTFICDLSKKKCYLSFDGYSQVWSNIQKQNLHRLINHSMVDHEDRQQYDASFRASINVHNRKKTKHLQKADLCVLAKMITTLKFQ